jgi:hypothetical protein
MNSQPQPSPCYKGRKYAFELNGLCEVKMTAIAFLMSLPPATLSSKLISMRNEQVRLSAVLPQG